LDEENNHPIQSTFATKVYPHPYVNKRITALFKTIGNYACDRKFPILALVTLRFTYFPVLSTNVKSSTFPMVYVAGFMQLAP